MKRYLACWLAIVIALSLTGCSNGDQVADIETGTADTEEPAESSTSPQTFGGWSEAYEDFVLNERFLDGNGNWGNVVEYAVFLHDLDADGTPELGINNGYSDGRTYIYWYYNGNVVEDYAWDVPTEQSYYIPDSKYQGIWNYSQDLLNNKTWCYSYKEIAEDGNDTFGTKLICEESPDGYVFQKTQDNELSTEFSKEKLPLPYVTISQIRTSGWDYFVQNGAEMAVQNNGITTESAQGMASVLYPREKRQTISAGDSTSNLVIKEDGSVWGWGLNYCSVDTSITTPTKIMNGIKVN